MFKRRYLFLNACFFQLRQQKFWNQTSTPSTLSENCIILIDFMLILFQPHGTGGFLTLHNLVCGVSTAALSRKTWLLQRGVLRLVSAAAAEQSLGNSSMGTAAAAAAAAARMRLETRVERKIGSTMGIRSSPKNSFLHGNLLRFSAP